MRALARVWQVAVWEWFRAVRSRRALLVTALYLGASVLCMNGAISLLGSMEEHLVELLHLPEGGQTGVVSETLWKSEQFRGLVRAALRDDTVFNDIQNRHPVELLYAWFVFLFVPLLTVLASATRVAEDRRTGTVRYLLTRVTRLEWSCGKLAGQALLLLCALGVSAAGAWAVVTARLSAGTAGALLPGMLGWGLRAWIYSFAWLGIVTGISFQSRAPSRATVFALFALFFFAAYPPLLRALQGHFDWPAWILNLELLAPSSAERSLWRFSAGAFLPGAFHLCALGLTYFMAGAARFEREDA